MNQATSNTQKVVKGISSQTIVTIVLGIVEVLAFSIMSRLLSKEDFGYYAAITAITAVFSSLSETGIGSAIVQKKDLTSRYINNAFTISLIIGSLLMVSLFLLSGVLARTVVDETLVVPLRLISVTLLCHCLTSVNRSIMQRRLQFFRMGLIDLISLVVTTIIAVLLAIRGYGFYAILVKAIFASILSLILTYVFAKTKYSLALDKQTFKSIFGFSGWLMVSSVFRNFAQQADRLLMSRLLSVASLGAYNRPKDFITSISSKFTTIFDSALFPVLSGIQDKKDSMKNAYTTSLYYMNILSLLLAMAFCFNSELIIRVFFGKEWISLNTVFRLLSLSVIFSVDGTLADCYLRSLALTKQQFVFRVFQLVLTIVGLVIGSKWGIVGVAMSVVIVNAIMILAKLLYLSNWVEVSFAESMKIMVGSWKFSLLMGPVLILLLVFLPSTLGCNIILLIAFLVLSVICFFIFPDLVGKKYKDVAYSKVTAYAKSMLGRISTVKR